MGIRMRGHVASCVFVLVAGLCQTGQLQAQEPVYGSEQVTQAPRIASAIRAAELLRRGGGGMNGTVRVQFIIGPDGKVEPESVKALHSTNDALTQAAESVAQKLEFKPGQKDGKPVRVLVLLPLTFQ